MAKTAELKIPIQHFERNLIFTAKDSIALYKIDLRPYAYKSMEEKSMILRKIEDLLWVFRGQGQFLLLSRQLSTKELMEKLEELQYENAFPEEYELWHEQVEEKLLENRPWTRELYVALNLPRLKKSNPEFELDSVKGIGKLLSWGYRSLSDSTIDFFKQLKQLEVEDLELAIQSEESLFNSLRDVGITRATPRDSEWMCRKGFFRSLGEPPLSIQKKMPVSLVEKNGNTYLQTRKSAVVDLFSDAIVQEKYTSILVHHGEPKESNETSHQAFLTLVETPENMNLPGMEWLYWLLSFDFPIDVSLRFMVTDPQKEQRELARKRKEMKGDINTKAKDNVEISEQDEEILDQGRKLEGKFSKGMPLVNFQAIIGISALTKTTLEDRVKNVRTFYNPRFFRFSRIRGNVLQAFQDFIPGGTLNDHWKIPCDPKYISGSGIHCSNSIGDPSGPYLGDTVQGSPVLFDMGRPMRKPLDRAGTIIILGTLGGGKSVLKKALDKTALQMGAVVFSVDPKGEDHCFEEFPEIKEKMKVLKFQPGETTSLPVFRLSSTPDRAWQIAKDFLMYLLNGTRSEERGSVVAKGVEMTMMEELPSMYIFKEKVAQIEREENDADMVLEAKRVYRLLEQYEKDPMAKVIFNDESDAMSLNEYPLVVASLKGLSMPKRVRKGKEGEGIKYENMNDSEKISVGIMYLVAALGREILMNKSPDQLGIFSGDEIWMLTQIKQGDELVQDIVKLGRSMNIVPILATQEASDVDNPEIRNNVGSVFAFRMNDTDEIDGALNLLKVTDRNENMYQTFRDFKSGECFFKDVEGRVNRIKVYVPPRDLKVFDTSVSAPKKDKGVESHVV